MCIRDRSVAVQTDGKIVVAGFSDDGSKDSIALFRYNTDGSLDTTFGGGDGIVTTSLGTIQDRGVSIAIQPDGNIVVGGFTIVSSGNYDLALLRYDTNGDLDPSFGNGNGFVTTSTGSSVEGINDITLLADGRILATGSSVIGSGAFDIMLTRYNADGSLDTTFGGGDGIVTTAVGSGSEVGYSVAVQADGRIIVGGHALNGSNNDFALLRYNTDGTLDNAFGGGNGIVTTPIGPGHDYGRSVVLQDDGSIVIGGYLSLIHI